MGVGRVSDGAWVGLEVLEAVQLASAARIWRPPDTVSHTAVRPTRPGGRPQGEAQGPRRTLILPRKQGRRVQKVETTSKAHSEVKAPGR